MKGPFSVVKNTIEEKGGGGGTLILAVKSGKEGRGAIHRI